MKDLAAGRHRGEGAVGAQQSPRTSPPRAAGCPSVASSPGRTVTFLSPGHLRCVQAWLAVLGRACGKHTAFQAQGLGAVPLEPSMQWADTPCLPLPGPPKKHPLSPRGSLQALTDHSPVPCPALAVQWRRTQLQARGSSRETRKTRAPPSPSTPRGAYRAPVWPQNGFPTGRSGCRY